MPRFLVSFILSAVFATAAAAQMHGEARSPYAGLEQRPIPSLSAEDVAQLRRGGGWGFALPAELNGFPGPRHVLELAEALDLTAEQRAAVEARFAEMERQAVELGERFVAAEAALSDAFQSSDIDADKLRDLVEQSGALRAELRLVHLSEHLRMIEILNPEQVSRYTVLRGYSADPCERVPEGHDPAMWRLHNNCE